MLRQKYVYMNRCGMTKVVANDRCILTRVLTIKII